MNLSKTEITAHQELHMALLSLFQGVKVRQCFNLIWWFKIRSALNQSYSSQVDKWVLELSWEGNKSCCAEDWHPSHSNISFREVWLNGWQLAKMKKSIPDMPRHEIYRDEVVGLKSCKNT